MLKSFTNPTTLFVVVFILGYPSGIHGRTVRPPLSSDHIPGGDAQNKCGSGVCLLNYAPVCGTDGITYGNDCQLNYKKCLHGSKIHKAYDGECGTYSTDRPDKQLKTTKRRCVVACPAIYSPICGTDGVTYLSECELDGKNNCEDTTIKIAYDYECLLPVSTTEPETREIDL